MLIKTYLDYILFLFKYIIFLVIFKLGLFKKLLLKFCLIFFILKKEKKFNFHLLIKIRLIFSLNNRTMQFHVEYLIQAFDHQLFFLKNNAIYFSLHQF